jgi:hypothetical protein
MKVPYSHGVLRGQIDPIYLTKQFLQKSGEFVDIYVAPTDLEVAVAHKSKTYIIHEHEIVAKAWGPLPNGQNCYLYWDINKATGALSRGFTTVSNFQVSTSQPQNPVFDQHWFDLENNTMKVWDGSNWDEAIRVFAGTYNSDMF